MYQQKHCCMNEWDFTTCFLRGFLWFWKLHLSLYLFLFFILGGFFFHFLLLFSYSCPAFSPIALPCPVLLSFHSQSPATVHAHDPCSLACPSPSFPQLSPSPLLSGHCQFVLYLQVSDSILPICLFCWLGSTCMWDHMVFVFYHLVYFT